MFFTHDVQAWLDELDLWGRRETLALLRAMERRSANGVFVCASTSDGQACYLMAPHTHSVLVLPPDGLPACALEVARRGGLHHTAPASMDNPPQALARKMPPAAESLTASDLLGA